MNDTRRRAGYLIVAALGAVLAMPLSNIAGCGANELVAVAAGHPAFVRVSPLLQTHCVDCHAPDVARLPAYASLPFADELIEADQRAGSARWRLDRQHLSGEQPLADVQLARLCHSS